MSAFPVADARCVKRGDISGFLKEFTCDDKAQKIIPVAGCAPIYRCVWLTKNRPQDRYYWVIYNDAFAESIIFADGGVTIGDAGEEKSITEGYRWSSHSRTAPAFLTRHRDTACWIG